MSLHTRTPLSGLSRLIEPFSPAELVAPPVPSSASYGNGQKTKTNGAITGNGYRNWRPLRTAMTLLTDGTIKYDAGILFGRVPKVAWENAVVTDRKNRMTLGLNVFLFYTSGRNILVDTGVGSKYASSGPSYDRDSLGLGPSRLLKRLKERGLTPKDIHAVILTHLHFDNAGGCTRLDRTGSVVPTFPKATYYVQRSSYKESLNPGRNAGMYNAGDFLNIEERGQLELLDGDTEIFPGVNTMVTDGHSQGHQIVFFRHGGDIVVVLGDLVPTPYHLNPDFISSYDDNPSVSYSVKREILKTAMEKGWLLVFSHGYQSRAGYLEDRRGRSSLRPVEI